MSEPVKHELRLSIEGWGEELWLYCSCGYSVELDFNPTLSSVHGWAVKHLMEVTQ